MFVREDEQRTNTELKGLHLTHSEMTGEGHDKDDFIDEMQTNFNVKTQFRSSRLRCFYARGKRATLLTPSTNLAIDSRAYD